MLKSVSVISVFVLCALCLSGQEQDKAPPKELVQYVQDAQKAGQNTAEIQKNAANAGWPPDMVSDALAFVAAMKKAPTAQPEAAAVGSAPAPADAAAAHSAAPSGSFETPPTANTAKPSAGLAAAHPADTGKDSAPAAPAVKDKDTKDKDAKDAPETAPSSTPASTPASPPAAASSPAEAGGTTPPPHPAANLADEYRIGAGDVLKITVWHEADASVPTAIVLPTGRISVPLLHEIDVAGLTVPQLEKLLTDRFATLINAPEVSVVVIGMNSKKIYMTGKVKKEGPLAYTYQMTVMQALTEAGGVTDYAKKKGIYVLRTENGKQFKLPFDYAAVLKGEHLETNIELIPGDMIVVP